MAKKGFTGSEIYFQDKFKEFDFWSRYNNMRPKEGFAQMWKDIKNSDFIEDMKMEEGELGKLPPLPTSWATGILRLLKPAKGLYELEKKNALGVSLFKTVAGEGSRRQFLLNMIGKTKSFEKAQFLEMLKKSAEKVRKNPGFKFDYKGLDQLKKNLLKKIRKGAVEDALGKPKTNGKLKDWDIKGKTKHAEGGSIDKSFSGRSRDI